MSIADIVPKSNNISKFISDNIFKPKTKIVLYVTGSGTQALSWLLTTPGGSSTILEGSIPYSKVASADLYTKYNRSASGALTKEASIGLANTAYERAKELFYRRCEKVKQYVVTPDNEKLEANCKEIAPCRSSQKFIGVGLSADFKNYNMCIFHLSIYTNSSIYYFYYEITVNSGDYNVNPTSIPIEKAQLQANQRGYLDGVISLILLKRVSDVISKTIREASYLNSEFRDNLTITITTITTITTSNADDRSAEFNTTDIIEKCDPKLSPSSGGRKRVSNNKKRTGNSSK